MVAVTFSYQAVESHCNEVIGRRGRGRTLSIDRKAGPKELTPEEIERQLSTEEKLLKAMPWALGLVPIPRSIRAWQDFKKLGKARDAIIHFKSHETSGPPPLSRDSMAATFLREQPALYPRAALAVLRYYAEDSGMDWLTFAEERGKGIPTFTIRKPKSGNKTGNKPG